jgi:hypothetical protein
MSTPTAIPYHIVFPPKTSGTYCRPIVRPFQGRDDLCGFVSVGFTYGYSPCCPSATIGHPEQEPRGEKRNSALPLLEGDSRAVSIHN